MNDKYLNCPYEDFPNSTAMSEGIKKIPLHTDEISCHVEVDVVYRVVDNRPLHLQIILPTRDRQCKEKFPLIVYVQGSAWLKQTKGRELAQLARFAQRGYVIAIVEYRDSSWACFPGQIIDTKYAIQFMKEKADTYFVDPNKLILWGESSGAHTVMMTTLTQNDPFFLEPELKEYPIQGVIDYYDPTDFYQMSEEPSSQDHRAPSSPEGLVLGGVEVTKESAEKAKVTNYVHNAQQPFLIFHGSKDRFVPFQQSVLLYEALKKENKEVECYQIVESDHGGDSFWNHEVFSIVDQFIRSLYEE